MTDGCILSWCSSAEQNVYFILNKVFRGNFFSQLEVQMGIGHGLFLLSMIMGNLIVDDRNNLLRAPANSSHSLKISNGDWLLDKPVVLKNWKIKAQ